MIIEIYNNYKGVLTNKIPYTGHWLETVETDWFHKTDKFAVLKFLFDGDDGENVLFLSPTRFSLFPHSNENEI